MHPDLLYQVALTMIPEVGPARANKILAHFEPRQIFRAKAAALASIPEIGISVAEQIASFKDFKQAEKELNYIRKNEITVLYLNDPLYPKRLKQCADAPLLLYYKGHTNLDQLRILAVVGTRACTEYGRSVTEKLLADLKGQQILVISGLAYGIDAHAHRHSLANGLETVGVLAHGLDMIYPAANRLLSRQILEKGGGLLTEFPSGSNPERYHFPSRNRIVAGLSDAVIVIESRAKGGSLITADLANGYNREVFAVPGKTRDPASKGCNDLIRLNRAALVDSGAALMEMMNWQPVKPVGEGLQPTLFTELDPTEQMVLSLLHTRDGLSIDEIRLRSGLDSGQVARIILNLELKNLILSLPGKRYKLTFP